MGKRKAPREKIQAAVIEIIKLIFARGGTVMFLPPVDTTLGAFDPERLHITIYKERTEELTSVHVFTLAHEYRHLCQYLEFMGENDWLFCIDAIHTPCPAESEAKEKDADKFALKFCRERKLRLPRYVKDPEGSEWELL